MTDPQTKPVTPPKAPVEIPPIATASEQRGADRPETKGGNDD